MPACITLLLLSLAASASAATIDARELPGIDRAAIESCARTDWFGVRVMGERCGWVQRDFRAEQDEKGVEHFVERTKIELTLLSLGHRSVVQIAEERAYDAAPPYSLARASFAEIRDGQVRSLRLSRASEGLLLEETTGGHHTARPFDDPGVGLLDQLGVELWLQGGASPGDCLLGHDFLLDELRVEETRSCLVAAGEDGELRLHLVDRAGETRSELVCDRAGQPVRFELGAGLVAMREAEADARQSGTPVDLFRASIVPVDGPLGDRVDLDRLELLVEGAGASHLRDGPNQTLFPGDSGLTLVLTRGSTPAAGVSAVERDRYLGATPDCPAGDPRIIRLAGEATAGACDDRERVERLAVFVADYVKASTSSSASSALQVLEEKRGDCTERATLFKALARATGIPCREVTGLVYLGDHPAPGFGWHAWNEVVLDGLWIPVDPTRAQFPADVTHIRLADEGAGLPGAIATLGQLRFRRK